MKLSERGIALIQAFESCGERRADGRYHAYLCPAGVLTIGWGHTNGRGRRVRAGDSWTRAECDDAFRDDIAAFESAVREKVTASLAQHQFDALVSFTYNVGVGAFGRSTLLRRVNGGDFDRAALEFHRWTRSGGKVLKGLVRRRASEALLFQGVGDRDFDGRPDPMPRKVSVLSTAAGASAKRPADLP